ncbi:MAG: hypothetical protein U0840_20885 [Gemmataceae bacterium]
MFDPIATLMGKHDRSASGPELNHLRERMSKPQRHRLLHGYPLAAAMSARSADPGLELDVYPKGSRRLLVGVLPHPFCNPTVAGCGFCTFPHQTHDNAHAAKVVGRVVREIKHRVDRQPLQLLGQPVAALYFGGGTANLSPAGPFRDLCRTLAECFDLSGAEVTLEGVPAYFVKRRPLLMDLLREEINARHFRISMGIQTFDPARLRQMGRTAFGDLPIFAEAVDAAHARGFTASADLLFNLPHQTLAEMRRDLDRADTLGLDHVGLYHLVLFKGLGTAWSHDQQLLDGLPDNATAAGHWVALREHLLESGFVQTTLTNFERRAVHATERRFVYEEHGFRPGQFDMLGFGPGGISFAADERFNGALKLLNPDRAEDYVAAVDRHVAPWDRYFQYSAEDLQVFYLTRRLAALAIDTAEYRRLFGTAVTADFAGELEALTAEGLIAVTADAIRPTPRGMFYADSVASLLARRRRANLGRRPDLTDRASRYGNENHFAHM